MLSTVLIALYRSEFDREWLHEQSRIIADLIRAEKELVTIRKPLMPYLSVSALSEDSILYHSDQEHDGTSELLINKAHQNDRIEHWKCSVVNTTQAELETVVRPGSLYSGESVRLGASMSIIETGPYNKSRSRAYERIISQDYEDLEELSRGPFRKRSSSNASEQSSAKRTKHTA